MHEPLSAQEPATCGQLPVPPLPPPELQPQTAPTLARPTTTTLIQRMAGQYH